jgi:hypothetical protein
MSEQQAPSPPIQVQQWDARISPCRFEDQVVIVLEEPNI